MKTQDCSFFYKKIPLRKGFIEQLQNNHNGDYGKCLQWW